MTPVCDAIAYTDARRGGNLALPPTSARREVVRGFLDGNIDGHDRPAVALHGDGSPELAGDEVADDREPEAARVVDVEPLGKAAPVVSDLKRQMGGVMGEHQLHVA